MNQGRFDRMTAGIALGTGRRHAIAGLLASGAAVFSGGFTATARKKKKKTCKGCPRRACCSCRTVLQEPPTKCVTFEGITSQNEALELCDAFCGDPALLFKFTAVVDGIATSCAANFDCVSKQCPVNLKA